jgi:proteasome lid subunit RPN8/RPN11
LTDSAREAVAAHAASKTSVEVGGVLVGHIDETSRDVVITAAVPAYQATSAVASLTFTHEAWDEVNEILARDYDGQKMVGWYHTHPRFGIFLSEYDLFIHSNFFSEPWQVAYVVDPVGGNEGFFGWVNGEIARCGSWEIVSHGAGKGVGEPDRRTPPQRSGGGSSQATSGRVGEGSGGPRRDTRRIIVRGLPILLLVAVFVGLLIWTIGGSASNKSQASNRTTLRSGQPSARALGVSGVAGSALISSPYDKGQLKEQWHWVPSSYGGYWEYVVTVSLATSATVVLQGTVVNCAPSGLVPILSQTSPQVQACDLSYEGSLAPGTSDVFEFLSPAGITRPSAAPADPEYVYRPKTPTGTSSAQAVERLGPLAPTTTTNP